MDVTGLTLALARIQITYNLDPYDIAKGILAGKQTKARMVPEDLAIVANDRIKNNAMIRTGTGPNFAIGLQWLEAAERLNTQFFWWSVVSCVEQILNIHLSMKLWVQHSKCRKIALKMQKIALKMQKIALKLQKMYSNAAKCIKVVGSEICKTRYPLIDH